MAKRIITAKDASQALIEYLNNLQVESLTETFRLWHESAPSSYIRRVRGRYWLVFLVLRFTGARIGEILRIDDSTDIDFKRSEIIITSTEPATENRVLRTIPIPADIVSKVIAYLSEFPKMQGRVFALDQGNFRREFYRRAEEAEIPKQLSHPHILRHTRAIELLRAGVPLTTVQDLLGHSVRSSTVIYVQRSEITPRKILREKGLI
jgi:integrase